MAGRPASNHAPLIRMPMPACSPIPAGMQLKEGGLPDGHPRAADQHPSMPRHGRRVFWSSLTAAASHQDAPTGQLGMLEGACGGVRAAEPVACRLALSMNFAH